MKALFICDDKEEWNLLRNIFHAHFSKVELICALKGTDALDYLSYEGPFGIVLIECSIKNDDPSELAKTIYENSGERPIIFIGNHGMLKDRVDEEFYMANEETVFLYTKPYDVQKFKELIQKAIDWAKQEEFDSSVIEVDRDNFLPLKLRNFYLFSSVPYDAYIELTKTKFIKALTKNRPYTQSTIQDLARRKIKFLYLEKTEHIQFLESSIEKIGQTLEKKNLSPKAVIQTQIAGTLVIHQYLRSIGISENVIRLTELIFDVTAKNFDSINTLKELLVTFPFEHGDLAEQAVLLNYFCEAVGRGIGWRSDMSRRKLGLAALLHDCMIENEEMISIRSMDSPDIGKYSEQERQNYFNHPNAAAELAKHFSGFTDVEFILEQHHELPDGSGFPAGLNSNKLTSISCVFILCSNFVTQIAVGGLTKINIHSTLSSFANHYDAGNFKEPFKVLKKLIKGA